MAQHSSYWCCSPFADWLRGTPKPGAATSEVWDEWYRAAEATHPIRYWIVEEGLGKVQDFVTWPRRKIHDVRNYIANRYVSKTHALTSKLKRGQWYEFEHRLLHSVFDSLVDYVEIEEAWMHVGWGEDDSKYKSTRRFWWNEWRCPEAGVDRLEWAAGLVFDSRMGVEEDSPNYGKSTSQAQHAQEVIKLYKWWKFERPARPDPYVASGWSAFNETRTVTIGPDLNTKSKRRAARAKRTSAEKKESSRLFSLMNKIEAKYDKEDDQMLMRLIKARKGMWT